VKWVSSEAMNKELQGTVKVLAAIEPVNPCSFFSPGPGMKPDNRIPKEFPVQVCVYLRSQN
jgi:hypothetical protein